MASAYPGALDSLAINKANTTATATDHPNHHNDMADAINKIERALGIDPARDWADVKQRLDFEAGTKVSTTTTGSNTTGDVALNSDTLRIITVTANNVVINPDCPQPGQSVTVVVKQDGTARSGITFHDDILWENGGPEPTITAGANRIDIYTFFGDGTNTYGFVAGQNFA